MLAQLAARDLSRALAPIYFSGWESARSPRRHRGREGGCHQHLLHVEAPAPELYTLGDLFSIWGRPLEPDNVAGLTGKPIVIYITDNNGVVTLATGDWHDIELLSHREITIQVGTPIAEIPNFTWTAH
jgi:hypothetical protein